MQMRSFKYGTRIQHSEEVSMPADRRPQKHKHFGSVFSSDKFSGLTFS